MNWRWRHIIPMNEVFEEINNLSHGIKKAIYGEWTSLTSSTRKNSVGLYTREGISDYQVKLNSRLPISVDKLNEYIQTRTAMLNLARADYKDVFACPFGCSAHLIGNDRWERKPDGVDLFINGRHISIRRGNQCRQVLPAHGLDLHDYVVSVVKADAGYELAIPDEISYVDRIADDLDEDDTRVTYPHFINLITERGFWPRDQLFVRMTESDAQTVVAHMREHALSLPSPPRITTSSPSIGNNRVIDLSGF